MHYPTGKIWIINYGAGRNELMTASAIRAADVEIIPVQQSPYDIWAASNHVSLVRSRQQITDGLPKTAFIISKAVKRTRLRGKVNEALTEFDTPVFEAFKTLFT